MAHPSIHRGHNSPRGLPAEGGGYLQVDPLVQNPLLIELAEEARVGHTEGIACHPAPAAGHATKDIVVQFTQDA